MNVNLSRPTLSCAVIALMLVFLRLVTDVGSFSSTPARAGFEDGIKTTREPIGEGE
jgi:hypothetical protein